jgi:hypothetical protein
MQSLLVQLLVQASVVAGSSAVLKELMQFTSADVTLDFSLWTCHNSSLVHKQAACKNANNLTVFELFEPRLLKSA